MEKTKKKAMSRRHLLRMAKYVAPAVITMAMVKNSNARLSDVVPL